MARLLAWCVHLYTATGVIWAVLALHAIFERRFYDVYLWMLVAVVVDGTDGILARRFRVKEVLPQIDGALLDNIIDYLNWSFVPAILLGFSGWLVGPAWLWCSLLLLCSAFSFVHTDAKVSEQGFFRGFPSYWNIAAFLVDLTFREVGQSSTGAMVVTGLVILCSILSVLPVYFVYPTRAVRMRRFFLWGAMTWMGHCGVMVALYPQVPSWIYWTSLIYPSLYLGLSLIMTPSVHRQIRAESNVESTSN